jgi:hypothetical protein
MICHAIADSSNTIQHQQSRVDFQSLAVEADFLIRGTYLLGRRKDLAN